MQQIIKMDQPTIGQNFGSVTIINNYPQQVADPKQEDNVSDSPASIPPDFFCISDRFSEGNIRERLAAELSQATTKKEIVDLILCKDEDLPEVEVEEEEIVEIDLDF